jgi:hypothetical protein
VVAAIAVLAGDGAAARGPAPLRGVPLGHSTGLRLVLAANPPFVLDVDTGRSTPVAGLRPLRNGLYGIVGVAGRAVVVIAGVTSPRADLYAVRRGGSRVSSLGTGSRAWPASDGRAVWVQSVVDRSRCTLRLVDLQGRVIRAPRAFPCATASDPAAGSLGLVVNRTRVHDPRTGRKVLGTRWGIFAVAGDKLVLLGPRRDGLAVLDAGTGARRQLAWPSIVSGIDQPAVDPRGRFVALAFADPAWGGSGAQVADVWLLDTETGELSQLPGMPAFVSLKFTSMAWTDEGRLVLLGELRQKGFVAVWRPGWRRLALKPMQLPDRHGGSDAFAHVR